MIMNRVVMSCPVFSFKPPTDGAYLLVAPSGSHLALFHTNEHDGTLSRVLWQLTIDEARIADDLFNTGTVPPRLEMAILKNETKGD
jgi:hypothetical protein